MFPLALLRGAPGSENTRWTMSTTNGGHGGTHSPRDESHDYEELRGDLMGDGWSIGSKQKQ
eukprot:1860400-Amphidinium_carterae.1